MTRIHGRVAFITGGASGAGYGQALVFGRAGARVAIADFRADAVAEAADRLRAEGINAMPVVLDVTDRDAYARAADEVEEHFGDPITLLFNTAGVNGFGSIETLTYADFDWMLGVNLGGVINGLVTIVPRMIRADQGGHVVTVASVGGFEGGRMTGPYAASKAAVISIMESYFPALAPHGIGVTVLCPANIRTTIFDAPGRRPDTGVDSGLLADDEFTAYVREVHSHGMDPESLAMHLKQSMARGDLYCIPYPEVRAELESKFGRVLDAIPDDDELSPAGASERLVALAKFREAARARTQVPR